ncbi:hypothetical protein C2E23DRAFT_722741 [Lenzites betulinus]|nr:hypothetical protein C2E23DRAFT_722741 [Lenzites betulinus]
MSGHPSPQSRNLSSNEVTTHEETLKSSQLAGWRWEICNSVHTYDGGIDGYLCTFLSSQNPYTPNINPEVEQMCSTFTAVKGKEVESYKPLYELLTALVADFPAERRPSFYVNCEQPLPFPFKDFAPRHHDSKPDLAMSWPGVALPVSSADDKIDAPHCRMFSMAIEVKDVRREDPFLTNSNGSNRMSDYRANKLVQISVNARNLIFAHGLLAAFTLGIYGDVVRIVRYDHACAIASPPMNITTIKGVKALQEFFWRFVHPWEGGPGSVVGADPTVRHLTAEDKTWLQARLNAHKTQMLRLSPRVRLDEARWVKVWDEDRPEPRAYVLLRLLNANAQLFSRSTMVWLAIEDTRSEACARNDTAESESPADTGTQDPSGQQRPLVVRIIKEAWRQLARPSEKAYYDRMDATLTQPADRIGLPALVGGCDMGARDVRRWRAAVSGEAWVGDDDLLSMQSTTTSDPEGVSETDLPQPSIGPSKHLPVIDKGYIPASVPVPMHQTHSWRLTGGAELRFKTKERSHMRMVVDTVGRPLMEFKSTKELVMAMYDAIRAHQTLMERCGILHRDVSSSNILIVEHQPVERTESAPCNGILHDFDYSSMLKEPPPADGSNTAQSDQPPLLYTREDLEVGDEEAESVADLKERTGTYYFMAIALLKPKSRNIFHDAHHDLESYIWVLVWHVLRHTAHDAPDGNEVFSGVFHFGNDVKATYSKLGWIVTCKKTPLVIKDNAPLTDLLRTLNTAMFNAVILSMCKLTYATVLGAFKTAIDRDDWPANDRALKFIPPKTTDVNVERRTETDTVTFIEGPLQNPESSQQPEGPERKKKRTRGKYDEAIEEESESELLQLDDDRSEGTFPTPGSRKRQRSAKKTLVAQESASVGEGRPSRQASRRSARGTAGSSKASGRGGGEGPRRSARLKGSQAKKA